MRIFSLIFVMVTLAFQSTAQVPMIQRPGGAEIPRQMPGAAKNLEVESSFVVQPADLNHMGSTFGGKIFSEMDRCAGVAVRRCLYDSSFNHGDMKAVTVAVDDFTFQRYTTTGDLLFVKATIVKLGEKSLTVKVTCSDEEPDGKRYTVAEGTFTFVSVKDRRGVPHNLTLPVESK